MALVKCKECGNMVSTNANHCPACGTKKFRNSTTMPWLVISGLAVLIIITFFNNESGNDNSSQSSNSTNTTSYNNTPVTSTQSNPASTSPQKKPTTTSQEKPKPTQHDVDSMNKYIQRLVDVGLIKKIDTENHEIWVDTGIWALYNIDQKTNIARHFSVYCSYHSSFKQEWCNITDFMSGGKVAKDGAWGFKNY